MIYLGDYAEDATVDFMWSTNDAAGASVTRATDGAVSVYKGNSTTQSTAGVTDTEDFDSLTGIHHCRIDLSADAFYAVANDYMVVLSAATIDGESVNAVLAHFSIENRAAAAAGAVADAVWDEALSPHLVAGSVGYHLDIIATNAGDPWGIAVPGSYSPGEAGWILGNRLDAAVSSVSGNDPGAGAVEFTYTLTETGSGDPIADADVWASTDSGGSNVVASGRTDQNGQITFYLDSGPVYIWRQKSGWNFVNPDIEIV